MNKRPSIGRGVFYTRDSGGEHEMTPPEYVDWARRRSAEIGVTFDGTAEGITAMIRTGIAQKGDLYLDYCVKGNVLSREGLNALLREVQSDRRISHVFIPRRDRLARPDDPVDGLVLEGTLRSAGITLVFMDKVCPPLAKGRRRDIGDLITAIVDYDKAEKDRRDLAQKIIFAQIRLAKLGLSTGGRACFGFRRWLVRDDGTLVRQLADGEYVKMKSHHVVWLPEPGQKFDLILRILDMLEALPASRVAAILTNEGVPTPDADRYRTDGGKRHKTSGVWHQQTITNIARNPRLLAIVEYGRRSMGDKLRFSQDGPRELEESDYRGDSKPKVVANPESARLKADAKFDNLVEPERHQKLLDDLDKRGGTQRGKPRSQEPNRNPLGGRIFDMRCGWPMYRQPYQNSFRYLCGLYQQSHGAQCKHNNVMGMIATRFLLGCIRQSLFSKSLRNKLQEKLRAIAEREMTQVKPDAELIAKKVSLADACTKRELVGRNLAYAQDPDEFKTIDLEFKKLRQQEQSLESEIQQLEHSSGNVLDLEAEVNAALAGLDSLNDLAATTDLKNICILFERFNVRLFLRFSEKRLKKRAVTRVESGFVTYGASPPPVALYEGPTGRNHVKGSGIEASTEP
jgi:hypothetical protein